MVEDAQGLYICSWSRLRCSPGIKHCFSSQVLLFPHRLSAVGGEGVKRGMITFGPCGSFHGSVGMFADPGAIALLLSYVGTFAAPPQMLV